MKRRLQNILLISATVTLTLNLKAQTVSTFEALTLTPDTCWNGSDTPKGATFTNGNAIFKNYYDTYWSEGFAYSNKKDSTTAGYKNMYAARTGSGYNGSEKYAVGQQNAIVKLTGAALGKPVKGVYITNGTYAAISMRDGDGFGKKFGGASGNDPDWFKLTIKKYSEGTLAKDSVEFYLADFRFADNSKDYIVKNWRWVDLSPLGNADSLKFILSSSDVGDWGINTPKFFCIDNFTTSDGSSGIATNAAAKSLVSVYPNPASEILNITLPQAPVEKTLIQLIDIAGNIVYSENNYSKTTAIQISHLATGVYNLKVTGSGFTNNQLIIKQ